MKGRVWAIVAIVAALVLTPAIAWAAVGSFTSSSSTPAVKGVSTYSAGKGLAGYATSTSSTSHHGVYGRGDGTGGIGVYGQGSKYGVYSNGPLGIASGKSLSCTACVGPTALAASAQPSVVTKDGTASVDGATQNTCKSLDSITITAAAAGKVTVDVDIHVATNHTEGTTDWFQAVLSTTQTTDCSLAQSEYAESYVNPAEPTSTDYRETIHLMETFTVAAGTHTYYVNVKWPFGGDASDGAAHANFRAMFFPS